MKLFKYTKFSVISEDNEGIKARIFWNGSDDYSDIQWDIAEKNVPSDLCLIIVDYLASNNLVNNDQIKINENELYNALKKINKFKNFEEFRGVYNQLLDVVIPYVDEDDAFWIHE